MTADLGARPGALLVVDDDADDLFLLGRRLTDEGHRFRTVSRAIDVLEAIDDFKPDVVLLDHFMPGLTGVEVCRLIRAQPAYEFLPVVLMTREITLDISNAAIDAGVNDFLDKAAPPEVLRLRIKAALRTKRLADLAARRLEEQRFLARLSEDLGISLEEEAILAVAARAFSRFAPAVLHLVVLSDQERPLLLTCGAAPLSTEAAAEILNLAQFALRTNLGVEEVTLQHHPMPWPPSPGRPFVHRTLRATPRPRVWLALEPTHPLEEEELLLFEAVVDRLASPLENARLYTQAARTAEELSRALDKLRYAQASLVHNEKLASIGQLAAGVAHEINNPLAFVISNLNVLREYARDLAQIVRFYRREAPAEAAQPETLDPDFLISDLDSLISESLDGSNRVHGIVKNLKSFAHAGKSVLDEVDVNSAVESTLILLTGELKQRCVVYRELQTVPAVRGDRGKLNQVFLNLVVNASQAVPLDGDGRVWVRLFADGGEVVFQVEDNGTGIPPEVQPRIFEPFFTTKGLGQGTGLGLAIVDEIVRQHRGRISFETEMGRGTTFTVRLPARDTRPLPTIQVDAPAEDLAVAVFIDDERFLLNAFKRAFGKHADVHVAQGGDDGIRLLGEVKEIDIVFCDLLMPRTSGVEVYQWICEQRPELADRFVILTAGANDEKYKDFLAASQLPVIHKPFTLHEIIEAIHRSLRRPRPGRPARFQ